MVVELTFKNNKGKIRKVQISVEQFLLTELIADNETIIKLIRTERHQGEVLIGIKDLDV